MNWNEAKILFKYPSRSRPERFFQGLDSIKNNLNRPDLAVVVCSFDTDDKTMSNEAIGERLCNYGFKIIVNYGNSKSKIHAVNRDLENLHGCDIIICFSDDMRFIEKGFDDIIRADFAKYFPDGDGFAHYPDQHQGEACCTLNITDSIYHNRFGTIYHPDYVSVECDLENQEVAKMLGRYKFVDRYGMFKHLHPSFGDCDYDAQYNKTEDFTVHEADKATRRRRKANNYDLIKTETGWKTPERFDNKGRIATLLEVTTMQTETTSPMSVTDLMENSKKTIKLKSKMDKKIAEAKELATEINALGIVKIEVSVTETSLK